jgi:hypothetical protein
LHNQVQLQLLTAAVNWQEAIGDFKTWSTKPNLTGRVH